MADPRSVRGLVWPLPGGAGWAVLSPAAVLRLLACVEFLRRGAVRSGAGLPAWVGPVAAGLEVAAAEARAAGSSVGGSAEVPPGQGQAGLAAVDLVDSGEAARMLGCSTRNVTGLCTRGVFVSAVKRGRVWWISGAEVAARALAGSEGRRAG